MKFDPQCGSNGLTYANLCELEKAHCKNAMVGLAHAGRCQRSKKCPSICTADYSPVCGSNGHTYSNLCRLTVARCNQGSSSTLHAVHYGHCTESNGSSHLNRIVTVCPEACEAKYSPLCASNGKTYSNKCYFEVDSCRNNSITIVHHGECNQNEMSCSRPCTREYWPICASNGITYANKCLFRIANCYANGLLSIVSYGQC
ncbi:hypothetical protein THRCLA_21327 [Thraustotheca clavata]|uniref:Kazal-like domain-containing protein n=1 Tax=Thraustotheca clavata TaxID=74557 RepID=A0A1V9ZXN6_9STRA|nr:hypothetical protein THRCLA_21327 [Thraustotheca clavata]